MKSPVAIRILDSILALSLIGPAISPVSSQVILDQNPASQNEPPGPTASAVVQKALDAATQLKQPDQILTAASGLIQLSIQSSDSEGLALSYRFRASALQSSVQSEKAADDWGRAEQAFEKAGDLAGQIEALAQEGVLRFKSDPARADELFRKAQVLGKAEKTRPIAVSHALNSAGSIVWGIRQAKPAQQFYLTALEIEEKLDRDSLDVAKSCEGLGVIAFNGGADLKLAEQYWTRSLRIREKLSPGSEGLASVLFRIGNLHSRRGAPQTAKGYFEQSLAIAEKVVPEPGWLLAADLNSLGIVSAMSGEYSSARNYFGRALVVVKKVSPESMDMTLTLLNLGNIAKNEGDFRSADRYYHDALSMQEKLVPNSTERAGTDINLASLAELQGDFVSANGYLKEALSLQEKLAPDSLDLAETLHHLGSVASAENDLTAAADYYERSLALKKKVAPPDSTLIADELESLGRVDARRNNLTAASIYDHRALDIYDKARVSDDDSRLECLLTLGDLELKQKHYATSEDFYRRALEFQQKLASGSPDLAKPLERLGDLFSAQTNGQLARDFYNQALSVLEKVTPYSPDVPRILVSLARVLAPSEPQQALEVSLRAEEMWRDHLRLSIRGLTERQSLLYASSRPAGLDLALTLIGGPLHDNGADRRRVMDAVVHSRALVLDEMAWRHRVVVERNDDESVSLAGKLANATQRLANLSVEGPQDMPVTSYVRLVDQTRKEKEQAELALAEKSLVFRDRRAREQVGLKQVAAALPEGAALVAIVRYCRIDWRDLQKPVPSYAAFVLGTDGQDPKFVSLSAAANIDHLWSSWRTEVARPSAAAGLVSTAGQAAYISAGVSLRQAIWDPLRSGIRNAKRVVVIPDGVLHLVNLNSLPIGNDRYLVESGPVIVNLSAERDLTSKPLVRGNGLIVIGDPDFNLTNRAASLKTAPSEPLVASADSTPHFRGARSQCGTFRALQFGPLPASRHEANDIVALWKASNFGVESRGNAGDALELIGAAATPHAFTQQAPGKLALHLATHGFFLNQSCSSVSRPPDHRGSDEAETSRTLENPLLLSGLALSGANQRFHDGPDGIITAEEIATLNLEGVDWAVLSGCDTGVGTVEPGEGVFGLRRAFQIAGVNTVIMSLWPVEDETSRQWMKVLYREHFLNGKDSAESVRAAALAALNHRRTHHLSTHPFFWAAFIASGTS